MGRTPESKGRRRVGRVSYYFRHGAWHVYYRDGGRQVRRRVGQSEHEASQFAARIIAQLACLIPTPFSFTPVSVPELRRRFLDRILSAGLQFSFGRPAKGALRRGAARGEV